ncbi:hypothetical protein [Bathymodiolus thermophilus thioautotrophic gill symbiont]|nr:hypothetical protein [Bathymodiolus thermophilus thioautotrophic gill symbiont]
MKKIYSLILIFSLIIGSLSSVVHAHESNLADGVDIQTINVVDDNLQADTSSAECHQCLHAHLSVALKKQSTFGLYTISSKNIVFSRVIYFSQINPPPSHPPRV